MFSEAKDYNDKPLGYAHLEFESQQDATKVNKDHKQSPMTIGDREIRMDYAFPWRQKGSPPPSRRAVKDRREPGRTVFLGNVPYEATREDIREVMEHLGDVAAVRICVLLCRTSQPDYTLNPGSYSAQQGRESEGVRTCRLYEYYRSGKGPQTLPAPSSSSVGQGAPSGSFNIR